MLGDDLLDLGWTRALVVENLVVLARAVADFAIAVVEPHDQPRLLPAVEPLRQLLLGFAIKAVDHVVAGESCHGGRRQIEKGNEEQGPEGAPPGRFDVLDRVEANDDMRQPRRSHHQSQGHEKDVPFVPPPHEGVRIACESEIRLYLSQLIQ